MAQVTLKDITIVTPHWTKEMYDVMRNGQVIATLFGHDDGIYTIEEPVFKQFKTKEAAIKYCAKLPKTMLELMDL